MATASTKTGSSFRAWATHAASSEAHANNTPAGNHPAQGNDGHRCAKLHAVGASRHAWPRKTSHHPKTMSCAPTLRQWLTNKLRKPIPPPFCQPLAQAMRNEGPTSRCKSTRPGPVKPANTCTCPHGPVWWAPCASHLPTTREDRPQTVRTQSMQPPIGEFHPTRRASGQTRHMRGHPRMPRAWRTHGSEKSLPSHRGQASTPASCAKKSATLVLIGARA